MRRKKIISVVLAMSLLLTSWTNNPYVRPAKAAIAGEKRAAAAQTEGTRYFYKQLTPEAKGFYDAMYAMYTTGIFKTGTEDYDLVANGHVTQGQLLAYTNGDMQLIQTMGAARDAFYADYPDIFYVDFSNLSIRVTKDSTDICHAYLGTGRKEDYFVQGFTSQAQVEAAIAEYEARIDEIVAAAEQLTIGTGESLAERQVKYVHDEIIRNTSYRFENTCQKENIGHVRTAYGALVKRESVCEGYSRAVKAVLDRLGISCILVQGIYRSSENASELHMWNYVKLDSNNEWYAVDATMDDPISRKTENGLDGYENSEHLLVGQDIMGRRHVPSGIMSGANYEFSYPELALTGCMFERVHSENGLTVMYNKDGTYEDLDAGVFKISYQGMGYAKAAASGKYLLGRFHMYYEATDEWLYGEWGYLLPDVYPIFEDTDTEITIPVPHCLYVEFAVTDIAPGNYREDPNRTRFLGDQLMLEAETGMIYNPSGDYVAPPYIKNLTPGTTTRMNIGGKYHIKAVYDDTLQLAQGAVAAGYQIVVKGQQATAMQYSVVENFRWDGDATIEFDFKPSEMWADDSILYEIHITGLVGRKSLKTPNPISYFASYPTSGRACPCTGYDWNLFGKPALLENADLSTKDWVTEDGGSVTPEMLNRLVLVATSPTNAQTDDMNHMISDALPGEQQLLKSETYNINLTVCKAQVVQTGQAVRVSLGFPEGYGPESVGVTFKAYHFDKNDAGEIVGMKEIPCIITQYGLLILCDSFSPFAIAVVKDDRTAPANSTKTVILSNTSGGSIEAASSIFTLAQGESQTFTVRADEGYVIEELMVGEKQAEVTDSSSMTVTVAYEDLPDGTCIVDAKFVAKVVLEKEKEREEQNPSVGEETTPPAEETKPPVEETTPPVEETKPPAEETTPPVEEIKPAKLATVTGLKVVSNATTSVKLAWNKTASAMGYYVLRYDGNQKKFVRIADVTEASYTDKACQAGKAYRYKVKAYVTVDGTRFVGKLSSEGKVITKPQVPKKVAGKWTNNTTVKISFKRVSGASLYRIYQYDTSTESYMLAYRVKGKKLYQYNAATKTWTYLRKAKENAAGSKVICNLTGQKPEETLKYCISTGVSKTGYKTAYSKNSAEIEVS